MAGVSNRETEAEGKAARSLADVRGPRRRVATSSMDTVFAADAGGSGAACLYASVKREVLGGVLVEFQFFDLRFHFFILSLFDFKNLFYGIYF